MTCQRPTGHIFAAHLAAAALALIAPSTVRAQVTPGAESATLSYADYADLALAAPLIVDATIRSEARIKAGESVGIAAGRARFYVEADVTALVRGTGAIPPRVGWLVDVAVDGRGRAPRLRKQRVLAFARPVPGRLGQIQLVAPDAQRAWSAGADALVRRIAQEASARDAPPIVTGIRNAFHVAGALPGEGETQIFLQTRGDRPAALSVLRRPGEQPRWSVALSEIIDEAAAAPARDTLLWYRLACTLPAALPDRSTATLSPEDADIARDDYAFVIAQLGACRTPAPISGGDAPA